MYFGEYRHTLDVKDRLRVPSKLKIGLSKQFIATKGTNNCLFIFDKSYFENEFLSKLNNIPTFNLQGQKPVRALLGSSFDIEEDNQGRFLLPSKLKEFANISKNVVFIGVGNRIEIWSEENYDKYFSDNLSFDEMVQGLDSFNI